MLHLSFQKLFSVYEGQGNHVAYVCTTEHGLDVELSSACSHGFTFKVPMYARASSSRGSVKTGMNVSLRKRFHTVLASNFSARSKTTSPRVDYILMHSRLQIRSKNYGLSDQGLIRC